MAADDHDHDDLMLTLDERLARIPDKNNNNNTNDNIEVVEKRPETTHELFEQWKGALARNDRKAAKSIKEKLEAIVIAMPRSEKKK
jgi:hypothetical protein